MKRLRRPVAAGVITLSLIYYLELVCSGRLPPAVISTKPDCDRQDSTFPLRLENVSDATLDALYPEMTHGGRWSPAHAHADIALIVPFREREAHLRVFLLNIVPFLQKQNIAFSIYIIEQAAGEVFNRAALLNAGFLEVSGREHHDCYVFHDVDLLPENTCNLYACAAHARHLAVSLSTHNYQLRYKWYFGGAVALTADQMLDINGFSNIFFGWGGEDDDAYNRLRKAGYHITRYHPTIASYTMQGHGRDHGNPKNRRGYFNVLMHLVHSKRDGLNSLEYKVRGVRPRALYTQITVSLPGGPVSNSLEHITEYYVKKQHSLRQYQQRTQLFF